MKRIFYFSIIALLSSILTISCNKDDNDLTESALTEEIADEIASSMGSSNSGLSAEIIEITEFADEYVSESLKSSLADTVYSNDTVFSITNPAGTLITYNYSYNMEYGYVFINGQLNNMYYNGSVGGSFDAPRIATSDNRESNWVLSGLELTNSYYILNGTSTRSGTSQSKIRNKSQINSSSQITISNVKVNKSTLAIAEGTLNWIMTGTVNNQTYSYSAVVSYSGNGKAELTINGMNYTINISTGEIE